MRKTNKKSSEIDDWGSDFSRLLPFYDRLVEEVKFILTEKLTPSEIRFNSISGRIKTVESFKNKIERKNYKEPFKEIEDIAGLRVVCYYESDIDPISNIIQSSFSVHECVDKSGDLGVDKMGYHGKHFIITLGSHYRGSRYDGITDLNCEIQLRTVLQDAWALISHHLVYKDEPSIPKQLRRDLNNVASLLEVAQGVFDSIRNKRSLYLERINHKKNLISDFLAQPIDYDTLAAYTHWKFPDHDISERWHNRLLIDLNRERYHTLKDIDEVVDKAKPAVDAYQEEDPTWFKAGTAYLTKSLGFVDSEFRQKHPFGKPTRQAFERFGSLIGKNKKNERNGFNDQTGEELT